MLKVKRLKTMKNIFNIFAFFIVLTCLNAEDKGLYVFKSDKSIPENVIVLARKINSDINKKHWDNILLYCRPEIQKKARNHLNAESFFKSCFPKEIFEDNQFNIAISVKYIKIANNQKKKVFSYSFYPVKTKNLTWEIKVIEKNGKLYLDFPLTHAMNSEGNSENTSPIP